MPIKNGKVTSIVGMITQRCAMSFFSLNDLVQVWFTNYGEVITSWYTFRTSLPAIYWKTN